MKYIKTFFFFYCKVHWVFEYCTVQLKRLSTQHTISIYIYYGLP